MGTYVIQEMVKDDLMLFLLSGHYVFIYLEGINEFFLLSNVGHYLKNLVFASPFLSQVILDFW
jgi:hypothetical protein